MWILMTSRVEKTQNVDKRSNFVDKKINQASDEKPPSLICHKKQSVALDAAGGELWIIMTVRDGVGTPFFVLSGAFVTP